MRIARTVKELTYPEGLRVGFVPTMGAFHEGHLSLMRQAKEECGYCVCSLFVNPTQFGPAEDFTKYPRDEQRDFELARSAGVDVLFAPSTDEVYGGSLTSIEVAEIADGWEGALRPGHFRGVATVVAKLFGMVRPTIAYFGFKDYQQCAVIEAMVRDLHLPVTLRLCETLREPDGLAMSSRNAYLSLESRTLAPHLHQTLLRLQSETGSIAAAIEDEKLALSALGFDVQYLAMVDKNLREVTLRQAGNRFIIAATLGSTRLIDNVEA